MAAVDERSSRHSVKVKSAGSSPAGRPSFSEWHGSVSKWLTEAVSKTVGSSARAGSNPAWPVKKFEKNWN